MKMQPQRFYHFSEINKKSRFFSKSVRMSPFFAQDVAYAFIDGFYNLKDLPPILANAIDYEQIGRELSYDGLL